MSVPVNPDHVYYDVLISNYNSSSGAPIPIYFNENRTNPIIANTGQYEMSIVRFSVDTSDLPLFIPVIKPQQSDINKTNYIITMSIDPSGNTTGIPYFATVNVSWITQDNSAPIPPPPSQTSTGLQSIFGTYYYCYSYQHFVSLVTNALVLCFTNLKSALSVAGFTDLAGITPPIMSWDTTTDTAVLSVPQKNSYGFPCFDARYVNAVTGQLVDNIHGVKLYFNTPLYQLYNSFPSQFGGLTKTVTGLYYTGTGNASGTATGCNYLLNVVDNGGQNQIYIPNITTPQVIYLQFFQEYSTITNWTPVSSIVFVSNTLPIVSNQLANPAIYNESILLTGNGNNAQFAQIITDIESADQSYKPTLLYNPTAEYRMISMTGNRPLTNVDVSVFWRSKLGNLTQLNLLSGGSCTLKVLFRKRESVK